MKKVGDFVRNQWQMMTILLRSIPTFVVVIFILAIITMNLLAQFTILSLPWLALNAGIFVSWIVFLVMDVVTKHYGARAATMLSVIAIFINLLCSFVFLGISRLSSVAMLDMVLGGQWSVLTASTIAFVVSAIVNNYLNVAIGRLFPADPDGKAAYVARTYISTFISQCVDNFLFVFLAFMILPMIPGALPVRWTLWQCIGCSLTCAVLELATEAVFSPLGYRISEIWRQKNVGSEYISKYCPNGVL